MGIHCRQTGYEEAHTSCVCMHGRGLKTGDKEAVMGGWVTAEEINVSSSLLPTFDN